VASGRTVRLAARRPSCERAITLAFLRDEDCSRGPLQWVRALLFAAAKVEVSMAAKSAFGRLRARDWAGSAAGFLAVLGVLVAMDPRVAHRFSQFAVGSPAGQVRGVADQATTHGSALFGAMRDQSIDHAPMLVFTAVAVLLVAFMVRT
jgi:hypothetical protein